jgi:hypothetical protein
MSNDLISRSALLEKIGMSNYSSIDPYDQRGKIFKMVAVFPAVDAAPARHGRWEPVFRRNVFGEHYVEWHACSICKELALSRCENYMDDEELSNYCPSCGAKMDAEVHS